MKLETQSVEDEAVDFPIERGIYYNFPVDDVERRQSDVPWVERVTNNASIKQSLHVDREMFAEVYADVPAENVVADASYNYTQMTKFITDLGVKMDDAHVPDDGNRFIVVPNWMKGLIKRNPDFLDASKMGDEYSMLRNGMIGTLDRMKIYGTTLLTTTGGYTQVIAGHPQAISFATQFVKTETIRNPNTFGDLIRGLQVYDFKVLQPTLLFKAGVQAGAEP